MRTTVPVYAPDLKPPEPPASMEVPALRVLALRVVEEAARQAVAAGTLDGPAGDRLRHALEAADVEESVRAGGGS